MTSLMKLINQSKSLDDNAVFGKVETITKDEKLMTTKELAEVLKVDVKTIQRTSEKLFDSRVVKSISTGGRPTQTFNQEQATLIKQEIQKHHNLQNRQIENVNTEIEILENYRQSTENLIQFLNQKKIELEIENMQQKKQLEEQAPKVEFFNTVAESKDAIPIGDCAKVLNFRNIGRNKLFEILREKKILQTNNTPYQKYIDSGYFRVIESHYQKNFENHISYKTLVYQKGINFLLKILKDCNNDIY